MNTNYELSKIKSNRSAKNVKSERQTSPVSTQSKKIDVLLSLTINVIHKKDEGEKCICSYSPVTTNVYIENEVVPEVEVQENEEGKLKLSEIVYKLKQLGYPLTGSMICLYSKIAEEYVSCGADPIDKNILIDSEQISYGILKLRCACFVDEKYLCKNTTNFNTTQLNLSRTDSFGIIEKGGKNKRTKERKIGYIIEKVNLWRRLYNGFYNEEGRFVKHSLDEAAKMIGISKKSLDDYLLQLRLGRKYGFNFNGNKDSRVGILRSFVKKNRAKNENVKNDTDEE